MKVCKLNRQCNFAVSSYLLGAGTQSCYNTDKCPYDGLEHVEIPDPMGLQEKIKVLVENRHIPGINNCVVLDDELTTTSYIKWSPEDSAHADLTKPDSPVIRKTVEVEHWIYCPECGEKSIGNGYGMFKCTDCNDTLYVDGFNL